MVVIRIQGFIKGMSQELHHNTVWLELNEMAKFWLLFSHQPDNSIWDHLILMLHGDRSTLIHKSHSVNGGMEEEIQNIDKDIIFCVLQGCARVLSLATIRLNLENIMLSEISQAQRNKHHSFSLICRI